MKVHVLFGRGAELVGVHERVTTRRLAHRTVLQLFGAPVNDSAAAAVTTKISQRAMASQGRRVLQRPIDVGESRAAMKRMVRSGRGRQQPATRSSARYGSPIDTGGLGLGSAERPGWACARTFVEGMTLWVVFLAGFAAHKS